MKTKINTVLTTIALLVAFVATSACSSDSEDPTQGGSETEGLTDAMTFAQSMGMGWNLGNNLDAHTNGVSKETSWGNPKATQQTMNHVRDMGFRSVRIPVTWMGHIGQGPEYIIDKVWMDRVAEVVGYAKQAGLIAILNIHHDGYSAEENVTARKNHWLDMRSASQDEQTNEAIKVKLSKVWRQIAERFKNEGEWLVFETMNEIHDGKWGNGDNTCDEGKQYGILTTWNQTAVDAIRAAGGENKTRFIAVPGYSTSPGLTVRHLRIPHDEVKNRILVAAHIYAPYEYAGSAKYDEWGHTAKKGPYGGTEAALTNMLDGLYNTFVQKGIPVYIGEMGCVHRSTERGEKFRKYYLEYLVKAMSDRKIPAMVWDNGNTATGSEAFGLLNHATGAYVNNGKEIVRLMVDTWNNDDSDYTLESVFKKAP